MQRLIITPGEPAGIGPDITIIAAQQSAPVELVVVADPELLASRGRLLGYPLNLIETDLSAAPEAQAAGTLKIIPTPLTTTCEPGVLNPKNAHYVLDTLSIAANLCLEKKAQGIVTGPVHKGIMNKAGIDFTGHTEFFAQVSGVPQTVMLFVVDDMKVALATTHLPLTQVPAVLTRESLWRTISILHRGLQHQFGIPDPRILVCGLNPHAGEDGYLGTEEIDIIKPLITEMKQQGFHLLGPFPADTIFTPKMLAQGDVVLAMYHDQGLPIVKYAGFGNAVNMTVGLPFIRTSVDHGTALDIVGTDKVDAGSMLAAIRLAADLCPLVRR